MGKRIYDEIIKRAFGEMGFKSVTILFPPSRIRIKGILRLGFKPNGDVESAVSSFYATDYTNDCTHVAPTAC